MHTAAFSTFLRATTHAAAFSTQLTTKSLPSALFPTFDLHARLSSRNLLHRPSFLSIESKLGLADGDESKDETLSDKESDKDWFANGQEVARQLKIELGIIDEEGVREGEKKSTDRKLLEADSMLEAGRAAARALLQGDDGDEEETEGAVKEDSAPVDEEVRGLQSAISDGKNAESTDDIPMLEFNLPSRKSPTMTICMVPPPSAADAWGALTAARLECRDPGFYRWPPHANLIYPFLEPNLKSTNWDGAEFNDDNASNKGDNSELKEKKRVKFREEAAAYLGRAASQCPPFEVKIDSFGTFGGKRRGVLWADPKSSWIGQADDAQLAERDPLTHLQELLVEQFPACNEQQKGGRKFRPHMTISHYESETDALEAKAKIEASWEPVSFPVSQIYLLQRTGDSGQFEIAATVPLAGGSAVKIHEPPLKFPAMPSEEEDWVREARMKMKARRNFASKKKPRKRSNSNSDST